MRGIAQKVDESMKACIYIKRSRGRGRGATLSLLKHCLSEGRGKKEINDGKSRVVAADSYGLAGAVDASKPGELRNNLLRQNHDGKSKEVAKHVVLSIEDTIDPAARRAAIRVLRRLAFEFLKVYAPGCAALAFAHNDRKHPHLHLIIANSDGARALHWQPKMLRQMQSMEWLSKDLQTIVQSGRKKSRNVSHEPYPDAKLTLAAELAAMQKEELEKISWEIRGNTRVFLYKGRRVRERTVERERTKLNYETGKNKPTADIPPGTTGTSGTSDPREEATIGRGNQPAGATALAVTNEHRPGAGSNSATHQLVATLGRLQKERRRRNNRIDAPEIT